MTDTTGNATGNATTDTAADSLESLLSNVEAALSNGARVFVHVRRCESGGVRALVAKFPGDQFDPFTIGETHGPGRYEARAQINSKMSGSATWDAAARPAAIAQDPQPVVHARGSGGSGGLGGAQHLHRSEGAPPFDPWQLIGVMMQQQTAIVTAALSKGGDGLGVRDVLTAIPALVPLFQSKSTFDEVQKAIAMGAKFAGANAGPPQNDEEASWPKLLTEAFRAAPDLATAIKTLADLRRSQDPSPPPAQPAPRREPTRAEPSAPPSGSAPNATSGERSPSAALPVGPSTPSESSPRSASESEAEKLISSIVAFLRIAERRDEDADIAADHIAAMLDEAEEALHEDVWALVRDAGEDQVVTALNMQMPAPTDAAKRWKWLREIVAEVKRIEAEPGDDAAPQPEGETNGHAHE